MSPWLESLRSLAGARAAVLGAVFVAGWPVMRWYVARITDGSDEPLGLLPLLGALVLAPRFHIRERVAARQAWIVAGLLGLLAASSGVLPPLLRAVFWVTAIAATLHPAGRTGRGPGWWALLLLSLPVIASAQFYLGYPLRLATTWLASGLLRLAGMEVTAEATVLAWRGERVLVDAPCSGIQMLWTAWVLVSLLACIQRLETRETLALFRRAATWVFAGNTLRTVALFCLETQAWPDVRGAHDLVGLLFFGAVSSLVLLGHRGSQGRSEGKTAAALSPVRLPAAWGVGAVWLAGGLAACLPLVAPAETHERSPAATFPGWAVAPVPADAERVALSPREERFARGFPGEIGVFRQGAETWIVRWVVQPTRKLHPAADCLRASGFSVTPGDASRDATGSLWSGAEATRQSQRYRVNERIFDASGEGWTDVSGWYWSALLRRTEGPWWAVSRIRDM